MRQTLTLGGALVGSYFGAPQLGFIIGSLLGNAIDPVKVYGPRLTDSKIQSARAGVPINWGLGRFRCAGTVIELKPGKPDEHEEGGKGGPEQVTFRYTRTFAILVSEGPVDAVPRIWADQKPILDMRDLPTEGIGDYTFEQALQAAIGGIAASSKVAEGITIYLGGEDQMPDPDLEAIFGAGNVSAHRGKCYVVFKDYDVTERGASIPNFEFEVAMSATTSVFCGDGNPAAGTVNVSGVVDAANSYANLILAGHGQHITGLRPDQTLFLVPRDGIYTAWSPYEDDFQNPPYNYAATLQVTREGSLSTTQYNDSGTTQGIVDGLVEFEDDAFDASASILLTGSTGYWLWILDDPTDDNRGGLSFFYYIGTPVPGAPGWGVDADGNYFNYNGDCASLVSADQITLAEVLTEISLRSGLTEDDIDVSECTDLLDGFLVARESQGDSLITLLQQAFFFDTCEVDGKIKFVKRGGESVVTITEDDLVLREGPPVIESREQEIENRPRKVNVTYFDPDLQYLPTTQPASRRAMVSTVSERTVELPITLPKDTAAQIADKLIKTSWIDLLGYDEFSLPDRFSYLVPTDIVTLVYRNRSRRLRIEKLEDSLGVLNLNCRQDRKSAVVSTATGLGSPQTPSYPVPLGPTDFAVMNLPRLRDQDVTAGLTLAARGITPNWPGCMVQISFDEKATAQNAVAINTSSVLGYLTADVLAGADALDVLVGGTISSVSDELIAAGANAFAVVTSDVAEIVQAKTATPGGGGVYALTDVTRGLKGTDDVPHYTHDRFVGLNAVTFLPIDSSFAGRTLWLRAVTNGTDPEEAAWVSIVYDPQFTGPVVIDFYTDASGNKYTDASGAYYYKES